jgi:anti-sigma-K factor RskA
MSSPEIHTLTGAYALNALDDLERRLFHAHLAECPDCVREVAELRATAAQLGVAVAEQPPESLRHRVMAQVAVTRQAPPAHLPVSIRTGTATRDGSGGWTVRLTAVAAAVATVAAVVLGVVTVRTGQERDTAKASLAQAQDRYAAVAGLAAAPDARGSSGAGVQGGTAFVLVSHELNKAVLLVTDLPAPPAGHAYQAWIIGNGHPRSVGLVPTAGPNLAAPLQFGDLAGAGKVGLTIEPAGGSPQPTTTPVVLFDLPT